MVLYNSLEVWTTYNTIEALVSFTMTKALFDDFFLSGVGQGWTLTLEEIFYLFAPLYFVLIKRSKYFLIIIPFVVFFIFTFIKNQLNIEGNIYGFLQKNISTYIIEFFVGISVAILVLKDKIKRKGFYTYFGIIFLALYLIFRQYLIGPLNLKNEFIHFIEMFVFCAFGIAPIIIGLIYEKTFVQKFLSLKLMVILGKSSYIFYLIHKGFIPIFIDEHITNNKLLLFIILNIISYFMFIYIEEPLNHFIRKKYKSLKTT
ncbi:acyltransferase [Faecalibacter bovis]|uniref:Acyltransferase n=1 Tax=Faecalibacter bovis TaxID=2898187 RepID=A0ABX7XGR3_9FLAO|nr:acyltransferase [Faecalibacter bovis]